MSSETVQSEWRRGGDPANPPIDRVGVWERRDCASRVPFGDYLVTDLTSNARPMFREKSYATWEPSSNTVGGIQRHPSFEFRYIGPLPGTEQPASPAKGDREAFRKAMSDWLVGCEDVPNTLHGMFAAFAESPAGRAAIFKLWGEEQSDAVDWQTEVKAVVAGIHRHRVTVREGGGPEDVLRSLAVSVERLKAAHDDLLRGLEKHTSERDSLASQLEEARKEVDSYRAAYGCLSCDEQHDRGTMCPPHEVRSSDPQWKQRIASLAAERDALRSEVALLREAERSAQGRVAELEKYDAELTKCCTALERWPAASGCNGHLCVSGHIENILERVAELEKERQQWRSRVGRMADRIHTVLVGAGLTTAGGSREDRIEKAAWAVEALVARCENQRRELGRLNQKQHDELRSHLSAQSAAEKREDGEKEPPLNRDEAIRRLWAMARGQRDQIEDLQERVKVLE